MSEMEGEITAGIDDPGGQTAPEQSLGAEPADGGLDQAAPPEPEPFQLSPDDWQNTQQQIQALGQFAQGFGQYAPVLGRMAELMAGQQTTGPQLPELDPFDPDSVQAHIDARVNDQISPVRELLDAFTQERGFRQVDSAFENIAKEIGEFDQGLAHLVANARAQYGEPPHDAIAHAAYLVRQNYQTGYEKGKSEGVEEYKRQLQNAAGAAKEPGRAGAMAASEIQGVVTGSGWGAENARRIGTAVLP